MAQPDKITRRRGKGRRLDFDEESSSSSTDPNTSRFAYPLNGIGGVYEGEFIIDQNGFYIPNGFGTWKIYSHAQSENTITEYIGMWNQGVINGKDATINYLDNSMYKGEVLYGVFNGLGEYTDKHGIFKGTFVNGKKEGNGILAIRNPNGVVTYDNGDQTKPLMKFEGTYSNDNPVEGLLYIRVPGYGVSYKGQVSYSDTFPYFNKNGKGVFKKVKFKGVEIADIIKSLDAAFIDDFERTEGVYLEAIEINAIFQNDNINDEHATIEYDTVRISDNKNVYRIVYEGAIVSNDINQDMLTDNNCTITIEDNRVNNRIYKKFTGEVFKHSIEGYGEYKETNDVAPNSNVNYKGNWKRGAYFGIGTLEYNSKLYSGIFIDGHIYGNVTITDLGNNSQNNYLFFKGDIIYYSDDEKRQLGDDFSNPVLYDDGVLIFEKFETDENGNKTLVVPEDNPINSIYLYNNNNIFLGYTLNGKREGYGELFLSSGSSLSGIWENGKLKDDYADLTNELLYRDYNKTPRAINVIKDSDYDITDDNTNKIKASYYNRIFDKEFEDMIGDYDKDENGYKVKDFIKYNEEEGNHPIVLIITDEAIECITTDNIKMLIDLKNGMKTFYPCLGNRNLKSSLPVDVRYPFNKITRSRLLVPQKDILNMIKRSEEGSYFFRLVMTDEKLDRLGSSNVLLNPERHPGSYISADHCQFGTHADIYRIHEIVKNT